MMTSGFYRLTATAILTLAVSGCAGGGGPDAAGIGGTQTRAGAVAVAVGETSERPVDKLRRMELNNDLQGLRHRYGGLNPATEEDMPGAGTATYNGVAGLGSNPDKPDIVSDMAMTVYFGSGDVTGSMWNFQDADGTMAGGSIQLTGVQRPNLPGGPSGEAGKFAVARIGANGQGTLDWGDHKQDLDIAFDGYIHDDNVGIGGYIDADSTIDQETSSMWGIVMLENDTVKDPVLH